MDGLADKRVDRLADRRMERLADRRIDRRIDRRMDRLADRRINKPDRQNGSTDGWTDGQTVRQRKGKEAVDEYGGFK